MSAHAPLPPSFAPVWGHCSGAVPVNLSAPDRYTPETEEGTAAHWVGSECLSMWREPDGGAPTASFWDGETAPNGVAIDDEITEAVQVYVDDVLSVCNQYGGVSRLLIEHRVHMPQIHADNWGTLDCALWLPTHGVLHVWDYKHGHRENRAGGNLQLINYVAGLLAELNLTGFADQQIEAVIRIVQPRCYHADGPVSEWRTPLSDLRGYFNQLHAKAAEAFTAPVLSSGPHCRDCPGVGRCSAARLAGYSLVDYVNQPFVIDGMSGAELAVERGILQRGLLAACARLDAIDDDLRHRVQNGATDTGLALQTKYGRKKWNVENAVVLAMAAQFGLDGSKPDVVTPAQLIQKAPSAMKNAVTQAVDSMASRSAGGLQLIDATDSRSARAFKPKEEV